jgi:hypothetical protein
MDYLATFSYVRPERDQNSPIQRHDQLHGQHRIYNNLYSIRLDRINGGMLFGTPFLFGIAVNDDGNFLIKYSIAYNSGSHILDIFQRMDEGSQVYYAFAEETLTEPERLEKEWLFEIINQRIINYIESFTKTIDVGKVGNESENE